MNVIVVSPRQREVASPPSQQEAAGLTRPPGRYELALGAGDVDHADLRRCAEGCQPAFERLYERHAAACLGLARSLLRDEHLAQDAVQEAFLDLWRGAARLDPDRSSVGAWLSMLTRRRAIDRIRVEQRQPLVLAQMPDSPSSVDVATLGQDRVLGAAVVSMLRTIPPAPRRSLVLAYWGGFTMAEIARITDVPIGTVKSRVRSALACLRAELDLPERGS